MRFVQGYADYAVEFVECLKHGDDFYGKPFLLLPWQREAVEQFYGNLRDEEDARQYEFLYLEIPKKNGKSELSAALGLFHLVADETMSGEVYICAADKENATIVFNAAKSMVEQCQALAARIKITASTRTMVDTVTKTKMKVMSSEAFSKHGYKPTCIIFDELHAQPNRELWDVMTFGAGAARLQPVWIVLTTAGDDPDNLSIGWEIHEKARKIRDYRRGETEGNFDNPVWLPYIFGLPDDPEKCKKIDIYDEAVWYECNPSLGHTIDIRKVRQEALDAQQSEGVERNFRRLRLNQWISTKSVGWMPLDIYDKTEKHIPLEKLKGLRAYPGLDLSSNVDLTAHVWIFPPQPGLDHWHTIFFPFIPEERIKERSENDHVDYRTWAKNKHIVETSGDSVDYDSVEMDLREKAKMFKAERMGTDPWNSSQLVQHLMQDDVMEIIEIPQTMAGMSPAMKFIERLLRDRKMTHDVNPVARWNFGNVRCAIDGNENMKPMKNKSKGRIDITVAWINGMAAALSKGEEQNLNEIINSEDWGL